MMKRISLSWVLALLLISAFLASQRTPFASAKHDPTDFTLTASFIGWNSTNPLIREFRGVPFTVLIQWVDDTHDFAMYTKGYTGPVSPFNDCRLTNTVGCLARSGDVFSLSQTATLTFDATLPLDDFTGVGRYDYYCEYHSFSMQGEIQIYKSPDINLNGRVDIVDLAIMASAYDTTPTGAKWNAKADLNNNGRVEIVDLAVLASVYDKVLVD